MRHVFICGAKSIGHYGGYETFVQELARHSNYLTDIQLHIMCKANGSGCMDESTLENVQPVSPMEFMYHGVHCVKLPVPKLGSATAIWYDTAAVHYCLQYCREKEIKEPVIYILTCRIGPMIRLLSHRIRELGGELHINPDGHEWKRRKWPRPVQKYWKMSERQMIRESDLVICDSRQIETYIRQTYASYQPRTTFIPYGAKISGNGTAEQSKALDCFYRKHGLERDGYYLVVCRFVAENNIEIMLREFMKSKTKRKLLLVMTENERYRHSLDERLHFSGDSRICFPGAVYDQTLLTALRENASGYLHGHEVGGTNPSLLESLGATRVNLLLQVSFNEEVAQDAALYWTKEEGNLAALIDRADALTESEKVAMGEKAKKRIREHYAWKQIVDAYNALWSKSPERL